MVHLASQPAESSWTVVIGLVGTPFEIQKGAFWAKKGTFGPLAATKSHHTRSKCVVTMSPTQLHHPMAVGPKSGPPGLLKDLRSPGPPKGLFGPNRAHLGPCGYHKGPGMGH